MRHEDGEGVEGSVRRDSVPCSTIPVEGVVAVFDDIVVLGALGGYHVVG